MQPRGQSQPLYHIVPITARVALYIVIYQHKRHEILLCRLRHLRLKRGGYPNACSPSAAGENRYEQRLPLGLRSRGECLPPLTQELLLL